MQSLRPFTKVAYENPVVDTAIHSETSTEGLYKPFAQQSPFVGSLHKTPSFRRLFESTVEFGLFVAANCSVFITLGVLGVLFYQSYLFFQEVSLWDFLTDTQWTPLFANKHFGIWPLLMGTLLTSLIAMLIAWPIGVLAAIYMSEFAGPKQRHLLKPLLEVLSGIPTVVYGYFALVFVTPILQRYIPGVSGFNALSAGIMMGFMITPMISSLGEDALSSVPRHLREAALGLGARKVETILKVVLPSGMSGILAATALAISRAVGETMIVAIAAGQKPDLTFDPRASIETMTAFIVQVSMGDTPQGTLEYKTIFAVGASLFVLTFSINLVSQHFARRFRYGAT